MARLARLTSGRALLSASAALATILTLEVAPSQADDSAPAATVAAQNKEAKTILMTMADFLAKAASFSVTIRSNYDAIQPDGQRIEFGDRRRILLRRPDGLRVEVERSDGDRGLMLFDGKAITVFKAGDNAFARAEKPASVDDALVYMVRDLQMTLPLARMLRTDFPQEMENRLTAISYVEEVVLFDVPTDHLAARSAEVDLQVWIAQGEQPLPRRVVLTYKNAPGQPQFRADLSDWDLSPKIGADNFTFTPPAGAELIPLLAPIRQKGSLPKGGGQ